MKTIAIDIGGTKFSVAGFAENGMMFRESRSTDREGGPEWMCSEIAGIIEGFRNGAGFVADSAGVGFGGPVDFEQQTITLSTHVAGWQSFPLLDRIEQIVGVRPVVDNDANVGALGEYYHGAGDGADPFFYMTLSTGIGGGIIWNGQVYRGADSFGGELDI
jgi:glucokinase